MQYYDTELILANLIWIVPVLAISVILLFILCLVLFAKIRRERKRYDIFMGTGRRPPHNLEQQFKDYYEEVKEIHAEHDKLLGMVTDMDATMKRNIQKVGFLRYNPFSEMGGNLCFALALLDGEDNGIVLNGIHGRTGSFLYAKPIQLGVSIYVLSDEEKEAIFLAKKNAYTPKSPKVMKAKKRKLFRKCHNTQEDFGEIQISLEETKGEQEEIKEEKEKMEDIGDVTKAEKENIFAEEAQAQKIVTPDAVAEAEIENIGEAEETKETEKED